MGKHGFEHRPTTVVQAPFCAERHRYGVIPLAEQIGDFTGCLWVPRGRILLLKQGLGKTAEIMNGWGMKIGGDLPTTGHPMRRHTQHQAWQWPTFVSTKLRTHFHPCLVKFIVLNRIHRAAMAQKHHRQRFFRQKWTGFQKSRWVQKNLQCESPF